MEFFTTFWIWLDKQLDLYISVNTMRAAAALAPAIIFFGTLYIMVWGYMHMTGKVDEPFSTGLKRILTLAIVFALSLHTWLYNDLIVDTFYNAPTQLASAVVGAEDPVTVIDTIWSRAATVAENLADRGTLFGGTIDFQIMAYIIRLIVGALCIYTMFLIALSKVALAVLLALGPLFILMLLFDATRQYFSAWIAQLSNYALITILTIMVCALFLSAVQTYAQTTADRGAMVRIADALNMLLICGLAFLFMMQVPQIAASLGGGGGLNTLGVERRASSMGGKGARGASKYAWGAGSRARSALWARYKRWREGPQKRDLSQASATDASATNVQRVSRNSIEPTRDTSK